MPLLWSAKAEAWVNARVGLVTEGDGERVSWSLGCSAFGCVFTGLLHTQFLSLGI